MNFLFNKQNSSINKNQINQINQINPLNQINQITFSTCWYVIKSKFPIETYLKWIKNLLSIVHNFNLVIYTNMESMAYLLPLLDNKNTNTGFVSRLPMAPASPSYTKYKIYGSPVELSGDTPFELSAIIEIQMPNTPLYRLEPTGAPFLTALPSTPLFTFTPSFTQATYFPPQRPGPPPPLIPPPSYMEIIFNPDGTLNNSTTDVYLHLHNFESLFGTGPSYSDGNFSRDAILAVRKMSGSIGVYEVGQMINFTPILPTPPNADEKLLILYNSLNHQPYQFAIDPRNKGI